MNPTHARALSEDKIIYRFNPTLNKATIKKIQYTVKVIKGGIISSIFAFKKNMEAHGRKFSII